LTVDIRLDFRCKACRKFKTKDCPKGKVAKARDSCKEHSSFSTYEATLQQVAKEIRSIMGG
jgi:hypothetical protein